MGPALTLLLAALLAAPAAGGGAGSRKATAPTSSRASRTQAKVAKQAAHRQARAATPARPKAPRLEVARASLKALMADRQRRRFRHHWERAIGQLLASARGRDAPAATLEAARARYALYRWSAIEADRDEALRLAAKANRLGAPAAAGFAAAVRREAGDDRPPPRTGPERKGRGAPPVEESPPEPQLEAALADLAAPAPSIRLGQSGGEGRATVAGVKTWASEDYTRVAVYLDHWVGWQKLELPARPGSPRRLALDFRPARLDGAALAQAVGGDQVDRVRAAQRDADTVRVVLELSGSDALRFYGLDDPPRLIVDIGTRAASREARIAAGHPAEAAEAAGAAAEPAADPPAEPAQERTAGTAGGPSSDEGGELRPIRRVVVDAGHGGHDPGAVGPTRVREKDVTLAIARRLATRLRTAGFEVVMTRSDDRYVALEERTAIANTRRGDLFISIHANANPRRALAGTETFVLNVADDRYARRLAARENGAELEGDGEGTEAARILTDLDAKASTDASRRLASSVQRELTGAVRGRYGEVRDLGVKSALFYVLLGARMPAVLVETAFISNRREEKRLASPAYQEVVAQALSRAVVQFARRDPRVAQAPGRP
ncbi:MAG: N-acetylmuramoyl-L-alanine amidase [Anaeromyxobacter sp.]|nr:N-acetylmuramoyl-L-alanine amidase [Anaeromyxobacter sp.]MBL0277947.1 N-acetylmuramoyl-L-alanine amidase [Anaeromyxobacter sp.]